MIYGGTIHHKFIMTKKKLDLLYIFKELLTILNKMTSLFLLFISFDLLGVLLIIRSLELTLIRAK